MSELKATHIKMVYNGEIYDDFGTVPCTQFYYKKDEADKVIAELEQKLAAAQLVLRLNKPEALYSNLETMSRLTHEKYVVERRERHQKYKRCLAMAKLCEERSERFDELQERTGFSWRKEIDFYFRWCKRWLEIAEKFKPNKEAK